MINRIKLNDIRFVREKADEGNNYSINKYDLENGNEELEKKFIFPGDMARYLPDKAKAFDVHYIKQQNTVKDPTLNQLLNDKGSYAKKINELNKWDKFLDEICAMVDKLKSADEKRSFYQLMIDTTKVKGKNFYNLSKLLNTDSLMNILNNPKPGGLDDKQNRRYDSFIEIINSIKDKYKKVLDILLRLKNRGE